jgi:hypothetical protein
MINEGNNVECHLYSGSYKKSSPMVLNNHSGANFSKGSIMIRTKLTRITECAKSQSGIFTKRKSPR